MEWSQEVEEIREWMPLIMNGRNSSQKVAATRVKRGTDIDFGALTRTYMKLLDEKMGVIMYNGNDNIAYEMIADFKKKASNALKYNILINSTNGINK